MGGVRGRNSIRTGKNALLEASADLAPDLVGTWLFHATRGRFDLADEVSLELFHVAKTTSDRDLLSLADPNVPGCVRGIELPHRAEGFGSLREA